MVLGLDINKRETISLEEIKRAYHAALLKTHPDKLTLSETSKSPLFTVKDVREAYLTLSDKESRDSYDKKIRSGSAGIFSTIQTEEVVDLDDMIIISETDDNTEWGKDCRCGEKYIVTEQDLLNNGNAEEINVQCIGCSLWIKVVYAISS